MANLAKAVSLLPIRAQKKAIDDLAPGVLLTSFVLIRQNAMDLQSERRNHLDLQINLLAERETTVILKKLNFLAEQLGVDEGDDRESRELAKDTPVESIARHLRSKEEGKENETG